jgi:hypothetical protein
MGEIKSTKIKRKYVLFPRKLVQRRTKTKVSFEGLLWIDPLVLDLKRTY